MARAPFDPSSSAPYPVSRSKIELFLECPRCFYLDRRHGIVRPDNAAYSLNLAVDSLLKKEFDLYRLREEPHPVMTMYGVDAIPFRHPDLGTWRDTPTGIRALHGPSNLDVFGIVDDVWKHADGTLAVVDYKATSTAASISIEERHGYKRQLDVYQWLLRANGFDASHTGYFVFANATRDRDKFDRTLEFTLQILPYLGDTSWIDDALLGIRECLMGDVPPPSTSDCDWCAYRKDVAQAEG